MGVWGTSILQNDTAMDVKGTYLDKRKTGIERDQATAELLEEMSDYIEDYDEGPYVWITLALIQWEYSELKDDLKEIALTVLEHNNIVERWEEDNPAKADKVRKNLEDIKEKLNSPMTYKKKIKPYRFYHNDWKLGDVYYMELTNDLAKEYHLEGRYILAQKVDEAVGYISDYIELGHIIPIVRVRITKDHRLPQTEEEFLSLEYVKEGTEHYLFSIDTESKESINRYFKYLANYKIVKPINELNEHVPFGIIPKFFEKNITHHFIMYNLQLYPTIEEEIENDYELVQKMVSELPNDSFMKQWKIGDVYTWRIHKVKHINEEYHDRYILIQKVGYWMNNGHHLGILAVIKITADKEILNPETVFAESEQAYIGRYTKDTLYHVITICWKENDKELKRLKYLGNYPIDPQDIQYINDKKYLSHSRSLELKIDGQFDIVNYKLYC